MLSPLPGDRYWFWGIATEPAHLEQLDCVAFVGEEEADGKI